MAYYVAQAALDTTLMYRPAQIVFGGGVISEDFLKKVRAEFKKLLNDYVEVGDLDQYITMPMAKTTVRPRSGTLPSRCRRPRNRECDRNL